MQPSRAPVLLLVGGVLLAAGCTAILGDFTPGAGTGDDGGPDGASGSGSSTGSSGGSSSGSTGSSGSGSGSGSGSSSGASSGSSGSGSGSGGPGDAGSDGRGPALVAVSTYFVDGTEVTVAQYKAFLAAKGSDTSGQPAVCAWNTTYWDPANAMSADNFPITYVDWCDALAFCTWSGKHLCGQVGGGPVDAGSALTAGQGQWITACGGPNGNSHPSVADMCNSMNGLSGLAAVATFPGCEGFYPGLFDLEGNAAEWVDWCEPGGPDAGGTGPAFDNCHLMGGSYVDMQSYCDEDFASPRNSTADPFGFRCCGG